MGALVAAVKPLLVAAMASCQTKKLICDLLDRYAHTTDNDIDDVLAATVRTALLRDCQ